MKSITIKLAAHFSFYSANVSNAQKTICEYATRSFAHAYETGNDGDLES